MIDAMNDILMTFTINNPRLYIAILSNTSAKTPVTYATPIAFKIASNHLPNFKP